MQMQEGVAGGKQQAVLLLWRLLMAPAAPPAQLSTNPAMAALCIEHDGLMRGISWALFADSWAAAGVLQALTHDSLRWVAAADFFFKSLDYQSLAAFCFSVDIVKQRGQDISG